MVLDVVPTGELYCIMDCMVLYCAGMCIYRAALTTPAAAVPVPAWTSAASVCAGVAQVTDSASCYAAAPSALVSSQQRS
jgi:hypothetical protein